ncbi:hypothetical protein [Streptomyces sp. NPDC094049]|uniref:hypothetical protein n=1 Tax=Streptomyces sp. NPDC094049 TaxID=3154987 RepID=UPI0033308585
MAEQQDGGEREPQPIDEEAAWAAIVAGYGEEPADPPETKPFRRVEDLSLPEPEDAADAAAGKGSGDGSGEAGPASPGAVAGKGTLWKPRPTAGEDAPKDGPKDDERSGTDADGEPGPERPALGSSVVFAPGVGPTGPRDYSPREPDDGPGGSEEGHFVPPEPPPLPETDATTRFAWLAVIGGPVLMLLAVLLQWDMTWWLTTLCLGGFLGGFATLVGRMKHDEEDEDGFDDPGRGAVV